MPINQTIREHIVELLKKCEFRTFCDMYFANEFLWVIKGTSILSGTYNNKEQFFEKVINRLNSALLPGWKMHILNTYVENNAFIIEMRGEVKTKLGGDYSNEYCWILNFKDNKIVKLIAYYDSLLVNNTIFQYEKNKDN